MFKWISNPRQKPTPTQKDLPHPFIQHPPTNPQQLPALILQLQFQCEGEDGSPQLITRLTSLYLEAIQHHRDSGSQRDQIYKKRMGMFLKKSKIVDILQGKQPIFSQKKDNTVKIMNQARLKSKSQMDKLLTKTQKIANKHQGILDDDLKMQESRLQRRIEKRRTVSNRSSGCSRDQDNIQGEIQVGTPRKEGMQRSQRFSDLAGLVNIGIEKKVFI